MSIERELLKGAVEWMHELKYAWVEERDWGDRDLIYLVADIKRIEELLAQPEHIEDKLAMVEPVAWLHEGLDETGEPVRSIYHHFYEHANLIPLYTAQPKREPLGLEIMDFCGSEDYREGFKDGALYAEKCHGIGGEEE